MDIQELRELIQVFESSGLCEIEIEEEGRRIRLMKSRGEVYAAPAIPLNAQQVVDPRSAAVVVQQQPGPAHESNTEPQDGANASTIEEDHGLVTIDSPMVGVFYAAPAPGEAPFVHPGDTISEDQTVCIVEAMKLMNEVTAKFPAVIDKVLVENGEPVEFGQPLFAVRPVEQP